MRNKFGNIIIIFNIIICIGIFLQSCTDIIQPDPCREEIKSSVSSSKTLINTDDNASVSTEVTAKDCHATFIVEVSWANDSVNNVRKEPPFLIMKFQTTGYGEFPPSTAQLIDNGLEKKHWRYTVYGSGKNQTPYPSYSLVVRPDFNFSNGGANVFVKIIYYQKSS